MHCTPPSSNIEQSLASKIGRRLKIALPYQPAPSSSIGPSTQAISSIEPSRMAWSELPRDPRDSTS